MLDKEVLKSTAAAVGIPVSAELAEKLELYAALLVEWNQKMNLTAITDPAGIAVKHFADSLSVGKYLPAGACTLIDVGTGAGFPGVPLALWRGDITLTLLDSLQKRLGFLETLCHALALPVKLVHARAEEGGRQPALREQFDVATARAVAALPVLCEYCLPFVKVGGRLIAMKGHEEPLPPLAKLGGVLRETAVFSLEGAERRLYIIEKKAPISSQYPRTTAKIAKTPL